MMAGMYLISGTAVFASAPPPYGLTRSLFPPHDSVTRDQRECKPRVGSVPSPSLRQHLGLFQHEFGRRFLLVGRIAVLAQDALDDHAQLGPDALASTVQSMVTFRCTASTNSRAMVCSVGSPSTFTALSLVSRAS